MTQSIMEKRFRSFMPVIVDVETGGFNHNTDALLEIAAVVLKVDNQGLFSPDFTISTHVEAFPDANIEPAALSVTGIDPHSPLRNAKPERQALEYIFKPIREAMKSYNCTRSILVGHNAPFDLNFINVAAERTNIKRNPFHPFSTFDTVTLCGLAYGQTVLARAAEAAGLNWNNDSAHSAIYDAEVTAELFCIIVNKWTALSSSNNWTL